MSEQEQEFFDELDLQKKSRTFHKLRILNPGNKTGESFGLNVPRQIAMEFINCYFSIKTSGGTIVFESGCPPQQQTKGAILMFDIKTINAKS